MIPVFTSIALSMFIAKCDQHPIRMTNSAMAFLWHLEIREAMNDRALYLGGLLRTVSTLSIYRNTTTTLESAKTVRFDRFNQASSLSETSIEKQKDRRWNRHHVPTPTLSPNVIPRRRDLVREQKRPSPIPRPTVPCAFCQRNFGLLSTLSW